MSSRRIGSTPFLELLPDSIAGDPAIRAAADALDGLLVPSVKAIPSLLLYARLYGKEPDLLPPLRRLAEQAGGLRALEEPLLDLLAWQLHVDSYDIARTYAERLEMVKTAIAVGRGNRRDRRPRQRRDDSDGMVRLRRRPAVPFQSVGDAVRAGHRR